jgi:hypothetical protein
MKRAAFLVALGLVVLVGGCAKPPSDADAVRAGINQHLAGLKTINLSAMDMEVLNVSVQGNQAQAQVEFRPKTGAPAGAGMQVSYALAKQNGVWVVQTTQPMGGSIQHPGPGENPHVTPGMTTPGVPTSGAPSGAPSGMPPNSSTSSGSPSPNSPSSLPNFRDLVPGGSPPNALPPGHPNINQGTAPATTPAQ